MNCNKLKIVDTGIVKNGKEIYNIDSRSFKYGLTTATKIADTEKVSNYITKYITKESVRMSKGRHRYLCSKNLTKPQIIRNEEMGMEGTYFTWEKSL